MRSFGLSLVALLALTACSPPPSSSSSSSSGMAGGFPTGMPISAPAETWTWVPFSNALCANGTSTGIGVNLTSASDRVLIYLEEGGACWNAITCSAFMPAHFVSGYGELQFEIESNDTTHLALPGGFFDRTAAGNPFKDYSYVYVPYCTGDNHVGDSVTTVGVLPVHFVGYKDMTAFLERIVPTFPHAERVYIAGSSAGGFGATLNWWQTQQAFGSVRVDLIDDSGTPMPPDILAEGNGALPAEAMAWGLASTLPKGCTTCSADLTTIFGFYADAFPDHRGALLSYTQDSVLPTFYGIKTAQFTAGLDELTAKQFDPTTNLEYFEVGASGHVLWFQPTLATNGVTLQQFLTKMVNDDPSWASVHP